jgi:hypothetical protein
MVEHRTAAGRKVLVRADSAGCTHEFLDWVVGQRLSGPAEPSSATYPRRRSSS